MDSKKRVQDFVNLAKENGLIFTGLENKDYKLNPDSVAYKTLTAVSRGEEWPYVALNTLITNKNRGIEFNNTILELLKKIERIDIQFSTYALGDQLKNIRAKFNNQAVAEARIKERQAAIEKEFDFNPVESYDEKISFTIDHIMAGMNNENGISNEIFTRSFISQLEELVTALKAKIDGLLSNQQKDLILPILSEINQKIDIYKRYQFSNNGPDHEDALGMLEVEYHMEQDLSLLRKANLLNEIDRKPLEDAIEKALLAIKESVKYIAESMAAFRAEYDRILKEYPEDTEEAIKAKAAAIEKVVNGLEPIKIDRSELDAAIAKANLAITESAKYTAESMATFQAEYERISKDYPESTEAEIKAKATAIIDIVNGLEPIKLDRSELDAAIAKAKEVVSERNKYTDESLNIFDVRLTQIEAMPENTQAEINNKTEAYKLLVASLELKLDRSKLDAAISEAEEIIKLKKKGIVETDYRGTTKTDQDLAKFEADYARISQMSEYTQAEIDAKTIELERIVKALKITKLPEVVYFNGKGNTSFLDKGFRPETPGGPGPEEFEVGKPYEIENVDVINGLTYYKLKGVNGWYSAEVFDNEPPKRDPNKVGGKAVNVKDGTVIKEKYGMTRGTILVNGLVLGGLLYGLVGLPLAPIIAGTYILGGLLLKTKFMSTSFKNIVAKIKNKFKKRQVMDADNEELEDAAEVFNNGADAAMNAPEGPAHSNDGETFDSPLADDEEISLEEDVDSEDLGMGL